LNNNLLARWKVISDAITDATTLSFPHKYTASLFAPQSIHTYLHVFADASVKAYGVEAYIQQDQGLLSLVMLKSRAAPLKQLTLPRLDLKAAVLAPLYIRVRVLYWIASHKPLQAFVTHRVEEIHNLPAGSTVPQQITQLTS